jgi:hypothetical protein
VQYFRVMLRALVMGGVTTPVTKLLTNSTEATVVNTRASQPYIHVVLVATTVRQTRFQSGSWPTPNSVTSGTRTAMAVNVVRANPDIFARTSTQPPDITETTRTTEEADVA